MRKFHFSTSPLSCRARLFYFGCFDVKIRNIARLLIKLDDYSVDFFLFGHKRTM